MLIFITFSGLWTKGIATIIGKHKVILSFTLAFLLSFAIYLLSRNGIIDIPFIITLVIPYELAIQFICFKIFIHSYNREPKYWYSDTQLISPTFTPDNFYMMVILVLGAIPLVYYANYLHNKLFLLQIH